MSSSTNDSDTEEPPHENAVEIASVDAHGVALDIEGDQIPEGAVNIDYFYDPPRVLIYEPDEEEPAFVIALPTEDQPEARLVKNRKTGYVDEEWYETR